MEQTLSTLLTALAVLAGAVFVASGVFSLVALWQGDLLEPDRRVATAPGDGAATPFRSDRR
ncbi:MAG TPA: hypothetical protein VLB85_12695 [Acidimicrobiia bacterium]|nr:hypothetical protein [Acidimicrobiia bacterium]